MNEIGFIRKGKNYIHPECNHLFIEFPSGPLGIGEDYNIKEDEQDFEGTKIKILSPTDCVGLPPGTGHAHTLLNNTDKEVKAIVVGEGHVETDKIFYPKHSARNEEMKENGRYWDNNPISEMGEHDGWTDKKRK